MCHENSVSLCVRLALLSLLSLLAACGGKSEQEEACEQAIAGYFPIINGIKCVFGAAENEIVQKPSPDSTVAANDGEPYGYQGDEYEPNTSLDNANSLVVNSAGTVVGGDIGWHEDFADNFVFTPIQTGDYRFLLCAATCDEALADSRLSLTVLDQSQTTIGSTAAGLVGESSLSIRLNAGVAYYAAVNAFGVPSNYRLVIVRADAGA